MHSCVKGPHVVAPSSVQKAEIDHSHTSVIMRSLHTHVNTSSSLFPPWQVCQITQDVTSLLLSDPEPQITPALDFLMTTCNLTLDKALLIVVGCPQVICLSTRNLGKKVRGGYGREYAHRAPPAAPFHFCCNAFPDNDSGNS